MPHDKNLPEDCRSFGYYIFTDGTEVKVLEFTEENTLYNAAPCEGVVLSIFESDGTEVIAPRASLRRFTDEIAGIALQYFKETGQLSPAPFGQYPEWKPKTCIGNKD